MISLVCPYSFDWKRCLQASQLGEAWHVYHCPRREKHRSLREEVEEQEADQALSHR